LVRVPPSLLALVLVALLGATLLEHAHAASPAEAVAAQLPLPHFWTYHQLVLAIVAMSVGIIAGAVWVIVLRYRLRRQTALIRDQFTHEAALQARYRDLFEAAGDAVWVTDRDGRIVDLNRTGERLLGMPRHEAAGRPIANFIPPGEADLARASKVARSDTPFELTVVPHSGPPVQVEVACRVLPDGGVQTIARDVTERKKLQDRVQRGQKLEAIGRLAGGIAHDFNNLLTVINGNAEMLRDRLPENDPARHLADEILDAGGRAANLTRQLLAFSRQRFITPVSLDLNRVITDMTSLLRRMIGDGIELVLELDPTAAWVKGDTGLIEQILMNLVVNARDAMPEGGTLTVRTVRTRDEQIRLAVADTGIGMDATTQARIFEPFFTTKPIGQGTGLGLATVYGVVQTLGGAIRFTSEVGRGTTFEIDLPPAAAETPRPHTSSSDGPPAAPSVTMRTPHPQALATWGKPYTVLLVEDDDSVRSLARSILEAYGLTVWAANDGADALAWLARHPEPLHLLITDANLPHLSGEELADRVRAERPGVRVLCMSGYDARDLPWMATRGDDAEFIRKPFTPSELAEKVRGVLQPDQLEVR
jgi:PAS domain S-box-containing protein